MTKRLRPKSLERLFVLQIVQPGLAGLIDGSISTLAPISRQLSQPIISHDAFLVIAASVGSRYQHGHYRAMSDDGAITDRNPWTRGIVCGLMTRHRRVGAHITIPDYRF